MRCVLRLILMGVASAMFLQPAFVQDSKGDAPKNNEDTNYFPLQEGYEWTYQVTVHDAKNDDRTVKVAGTKKFGDTVCFQISAGKGDLDMFNFGKDLYLSSSKEGVFVYSEAVKTNPWMQVLKYPMKKDDVWCESKSEDITTRYRNAGEEEVQVPAGKFKCYKIILEGEKEGLRVALNNFWYAPGVGLVKSGEGIGMGHGTTLYELKSFTKGKK